MTAPTGLNALLAAQSTRKRLTVNNTDDGPATPSPRTVPHVQHDTVPPRRKAGDSAKASNEALRPSDRVAGATAECRAFRANLAVTLYNGSGIPTSSGPVRPTQSHTAPHRRKAEVSANACIGALGTDQMVYMVADADGNEHVVALGNVPEANAQLLQAGAAGRQVNRRLKQAAHRRNRKEMRSQAPPPTRIKGTQTTIA